MKNLFLSLFVIFSSTFLFAQPVLTPANFIPLVGESQLYYVADTNSVLDTTTGANVIFDYTNLRDLGTTQTQYFVDPTSTANSSDYPTATYTDTTDGFPGNLKYNQSFSPDSLNIIGLVLEINTFGTVVAKFDDDPEKIMTFPFNYGDSFTDAYGGEFTSSSAPQPTTGNGTVTVSADAWGTLKLPNFIDVDSVLRVVRDEYLKTDTIFLQPFFPNILPIEVTAVQTSYYKPSISKSPLLSFIETNVAGDVTTAVLSQYDVYGVGVEELKEELAFNIFPNPSNNASTISFELRKRTVVTAQLMNSLGQKITTLFDGELPTGKNKIEINTNQLSKGFYLVNLTIDNKTISTKLLVE